MGSGRRAPLITAGLLLGVGLGGFVDGILLHQILQWHHMLTSAGYPATSIDNLQLNTFWDGLFHAFTWLMTVIGLLLLWRAGSRDDVPWSPRTFIGSILGGWGLFNLIEGLVDHQILAIHHVRPGPDQPAWDLGYLALGAALLAAGSVLVEAGRRDAASTSRRENAGGGRETDRADY